MKYKTKWKVNSLNKAFWKEVLVNRKIVDLKFNKYGLSSIHLDNGEVLFTTDYYFKLREELPKDTKIENKGAFLIEMENEPMVVRESPTLLTKEQMQKLTTMRLLAYKNRLMKVPESESGDGSLNKQSPVWIKVIAEIKEILATRENVDKNKKVKQSISHD
jgi:hypothetical protein